MDGAVETRCRGRRETRSISRLRIRCGDVLRLLERDGGLHRPARKVHETKRRQPERQAIRLKLLEIYAGRKDATTYAQLAREMYDQTGGQNEEWPKVITMGLAIDPDNPLYTGDGDGLGAAPAATAVQMPPGYDEGCFLIDPQTWTRELAQAALADPVGDARLARQAPRQLGALALLLGPRQRQHRPARRPMSPRR